MAEDKGVKKSIRRKKKRKPLPDDPSDVQMTLGEHLEELRWRLIYAIGGLIVAMAICLIFGKDLINMLTHSYVKAMTEMGQEHNLSVRSLTEGFTRYLTVALIGGIIIASPWIFYQLWMFVAAGLYPHERKYVIYAVPFSSLLFITGSMFFLLVASTQIIKFFIHINIWLELDQVIMLKEYIQFMTRLTLVFGLAFQMPLAVLILAKMGIVSVKTLNHYRRHVILGILIIAAMLSPPDPFSQLALALPMWLLYELGVVLVYFMVTRKQTEAQG